MKLKTKVHITRVLWVTVSAGYEAAKFDNDFSWDPKLRLRDGIGIETDSLRDELEDNADNQHYRDFLQASVNAARWQNCEELFFHR
jgi:hypothetical protein